MGLPVKRTQYIIYLTSATLAALASIVYTANIGSAKNTVGVGWELDAVASVVIGGTIITGGFGYVLGSGEPRIGAHGKPVLFLHPKDFLGTLVELEQA